MKPRKMRRRRFSSRSGISEVVGALLLIMVVVIAVGSFAFYLSNAQQQAETRASFQSSIKNEDLRIQNMVLNVTSAGKVIEITLTVINLNVQNSGLSGVEVSNQWVQNFSNYGEVFNSSFPLEILERQFTIINLNTSSFTPPIYRNQSLEIILESTAGNYFTSVYQNPSAVITETPYVEYADSTTTDIPEFSAVSSVPGNGSIVSYNWNFTSGTSFCALPYSTMAVSYSTIFTYASSSSAPASCSAFASLASSPGSAGADGFNVELTIQDSNGLTSSTVLPYPPDSNLLS